MNEGYRPIYLSSDVEDWCHRLLCVSSPYSVQQSIFAQSGWPTRLLLTTMPSATHACHRNQPRPYQPPPGVSSRHMRDFVHTTSCYHKEITAHIQQEIHEVENEVEIIRDCTQDEEVHLEYAALLLDPGSTRGCLTLYQKALNFLWTSKLMMGKTLVEKGEAYSEILLHQDEMMEIL